MRLWQSHMLKPAAPAMSAPGHWAAKCGEDDNTRPIARPAVDSNCAVAEGRRWVVGVPMVIEWMSEDMDTPTANK
ncbi:hypothetical protein JY96_19695 [Aquabacterium sp. NJ1]|nr:hypothetical protein JY96_19695 [Aquabacterium sp. NJ1]